MKNLAQVVTCLCPSVEELTSWAPVLGLKTARLEVVSKTVNMELETVLIRQHSDSKLVPVIVENRLGGRMLFNHGEEHVRSEQF